MDEFELELAGDTLLVKPQENGSFDVWLGASKLGNLEPNVNDRMQVDWLSTDLIGYDYAQQIGELIFERDL